MANATTQLPSTASFIYTTNTSSWLSSTVAMTTEKVFSTTMDIAMTTLNSSMEYNVTTPSVLPGTCAVAAPGKVVASTSDGNFNKIMVPSFVLTCLMFAIGVPGNLLVFYVYWRRWRKTTSRVFIMALAAFDLINCFSMIFEMEIIWNILQFDHPGRCKFARMATFMMNNASSFTLLTIAIDRFMRICRPLKPALVNRQAKIAVAVSVIVAIIFSWPAAVIYGTFTVVMPVPKAPHVCIYLKLCLIEDDFVNSDYPLIFTSVLLAGNLLIDLVLIICYTCIAVQVVRRGQFNDGCLKKRSDSLASNSTDVIEASENVFKATPIVIARQGSISPSETREGEDGKDGEKHGLERVVNGSTSRSTGSGSVRSKQSVSFKRKQFQKQRSLSVQSIESRRAQMYKTTLMLFLVTLLFMVSFIPYCVIVIIRYINPNYYNELSDSGKAGFQFFLRTYLLSCALNPVIYSFMSDQFRNECKSVFKRIVCLQKRGRINS